MTVEEERQCVDCQGWYGTWNMDRLLPSQMTGPEHDEYEKTERRPWICGDCLAERLNPLPLELL